ncbi:hypothetical protein BCR36DRAFT_416970 [Piromyces finnis]|uniref:P-loop containing nucleoside triphosphate hydrolase protein n=1 Tax=Piromyces finnis TaxID=1754191 RepID=A0A1Y1UNE4_9FUNG|nr:hypothetical protein BCR36DRAFT_416970 [Piromyces finnis]|eukprot:ORX39512.1 hypothetical protein BCR36DRAFT_416970 [Piromyces finnis]
MLFNRKKKIIPVPEQPSESPYNSASFFSKITYSWENKLFRIGYNRPLQPNDIYLLPYQFKEENNEKKFYHYWNEQKNIQGIPRSIFKCMWKIYGNSFIIAGILKLISDISSLVTPIFLELLLNFLEDFQNESSITQLPIENSSTISSKSWQEILNPYMGWIYISLIFICQLIYTLCGNYFSSMVLDIGLSIYSTINGIIYNKTLRLTNKEMQSIGGGKIVNIMSTDSYRIWQLSVYGHYIWSSPLQLFIIQALLIRSLGIWSFIGLSIFLFIIPIQLLVMKILISLRKKTANLTDERVKKTQEVIGNIRIIKYFGWEKIFQSIIFKLRDKELKLTKYSIITNSITTAVFNVIPFFASALTFIAYSANGNILTAAKVFSCHALFNKLCNPLTSLSTTFNQFTNGIIGLKRASYIMNGKELDNLTEINPMAEFGVSIRNGNFNWEAGRPEDILEKSNREKKLRHTNNKLKKRHQEEEKQSALKIEMSKRRRYSQVESLCKDNTDIVADSNNLNGAIATDDMLDQSNNNDNNGFFENVLKSLNSFCLQDINLCIKKGSLTAIVGGVGSGKSSLINAIIGEMKQESGRVIIGGSYSYCSQKAWIRNANIRDNIILGKPFDKTRYDAAVKCCALRKDFRILSNGDMTELVEGGANLSGGQKQRINLARAVYDNSDIVFMDDPLSAVDAHVSRFLFDKCINGALAKKTRILVTHQLHLLSKVDYIVVMKNGRIEEQGQYKELLIKNGELARLLKVSGDNESETKENYEESLDISTISDSDITKCEFDSSESIASSISEEDNKKPVQGIISQEERPTGSIKTKVYNNYIKASGGYIVCIFILLLVGLTQIIKLGSDTWLVYWTEDTLGMKTNDYILIYLFWNLGQTIVIFIYYVVMANVGIKASKRVHNNAIDRVLKAPIFFFDSNPLGRIINRFSMDQDSLDNNLFPTLQVFLTGFGSTFSTLALMLYASPILGVAVVPLLIIYYFIQLLYRHTNRELKRLDALKRSPIYNHLSETINGLSTIRSYHEQEHLIKHNQYLINENNRPTHLILTAERWMKVRLELIGSFLVLLNGCAGMLLKDSLSISLLGLSLSYAIQLTSNLNTSVRNLCKTEVYMNSAERLLHYAEEIKIEKQDGKDAPLGWPTHGKVEIKNLTMSYAPFLPPTIRNVSLNINSHEKIGIVGRTGAGKSSIIMNLFRMVEPELGSFVAIDDISILDMKLSNLRKNISIIPQEPVLFSGTIRFNMDPLNEHTDNEIWNALENSGVKELVMNMENKLEAEVLCHGENFSVGQRQLLCLARAMIRNSHVIILDEATASCDIETDSIIQKALRNHFNESTIITVAHRLNTIIDYDRILVLDKGELIEYDSPKNLLFKYNSNQELTPIHNTEFSKLVDETGVSNSELLRQMALYKKI